MAGYETVLSTANQICRFLLFDLSLSFLTTGQGNKDSKNENAMFLSLRKPAGSVDWQRYRSVTSSDVIRWSEGKNGFFVMKMKLEFR